MRNLFDTDGPLFRAMQDLTSLVVLNILTLLCCIPIITAGAALASLHFCLYQMVDGTEGRPSKSFWKQMRGNLRSVTGTWIVFLLILAVVAFEWYLFKGQDGAGRIFMIMIYVAALFVSMLAVWLFPLTAKFELSVKGALLNSVILAASHLPRTLLMVCLMTVIPFVLTQDMRLIPLGVLLGISLPAYLCALVYHAVIHKMVKAENPEE